MQPSNSVSYILGFCAAVCLACSVVVATSAVGLKARQEANKELDRQKKVLAVAGLIKEGQALRAEQVRELFQKRIKSVIVGLQNGKIDEAATKEAAKFDQQKAKAEPKTSRKAPKNMAGVDRVPLQGLVFLVSKTDMDAKGNGFSLNQYIFPIEGKGLWSTLFGFIALASDFNEITGLTFYQHGETPGLGGEVDNAGWKAKWQGRLAFGQKGSNPSTWKDPKIEVIKGLAGNAKEDPYRVDGLSGATITSKGVSNLVRFWLGEHGFGKFIQNNLTQPAPIRPMPEPIRPMPAPIRPMPAPIRPMPAPIRPMPAPIRPMPAPIRPMPAPIRPTPAPASRPAATPKLRAATSLPAAASQPAPSTQPRGVQR